MGSDQESPPRPGNPQAGGIITGTEILPEEQGVQAPHRAFPALGICTSEKIIPLALKFSRP